MTNYNFYNNQYLTFSFSDTESLRALRVIWYMGFAVNGFSPSVMTYGNFSRLSGVLNGKPAMCNQAPQLWNNVLEVFVFIPKKRYTKKSK